MKSLICHFFLILIPSFIYGQLDEYRISDYLYPDVKRSVMSISPSLNLYRYQEFEKESYRSLLFGGYFQGSKTSNSRKRQFSAFLSSDFYYTRNSQESDEFNRFFGSSNINIVNRNFIESKKFFEMEIRSSIASNNRTWNTRGQLDELVFDFSLSPKIGFGRIENISDSWHGLTILQILKEKGGLLNDLTFEEITLFAQEISRIKNLRNTDFRLERISEFEALFEYLIKNDLIESEDYKSIALTQDAFDYEQFRQRFQGKTLTIGLLFDFARGNTNISEPGHGALNIYGLEIELRNSQALSKTFQFDQTIALSGGYWNYKPQWQSHYNEFRFAQLNLNFALGYYPNQRTNFRLRPYAFYRYFQEAEAYRLSAGISLNGSYYISPRLRYRLSSGISIYELNDNIDLQYDTSTSSINISMDYFFR